MGYHNHMSVPAPRPPSLLAQPSYLASQVSKLGRRHLKVVLGEHGLLLAHLAILSALEDLGSLSQQQLADSLDLDKSHLVGFIDHLEKRDLLTRTQDPSDRRRNRVTLTSEGRALVEQLRPVAQHSQQGLLDALSAAEQETLMSLLRRVLDANDAAARYTAPEEERMGHTAR